MPLGKLLWGLRIGEQTKAGKGLALAQIAADTARALSGALANANSPTPDNIATGGLAGIAKYIALATQILGNAKRARDILKGGGSTSVSTGGGATAVPQISTRQFQASSMGKISRVRPRYMSPRETSLALKNESTTCNGFLWLVAKNKKSLIKRKWNFQFTN
jgi:hypothetical protein